MCSSIDEYINGLMQDYSISSASVMEILQSCSEPSIYPANIFNDNFVEINLFGIEEIVHRVLICISQQSECNMKRDTSLYVIRKL